ncbi:MAG: hypothetical protein WC755_00410 [Candidatus Woesearchaeota archaeon]|jgi:hypothetical protein
MSNKISAQIVEVARNNNSKLFAKGKQPNEFYFVSEKENDAGFFNFVQGNLIHSGNKFNVELETNGRDATLIVPKQFTDIHRDGLVYVIDTNYPQHIMEPTSIWAINRQYMNFTKEYMKINQFISYPCLSAKKEGIGIYRGYENSIFQTDIWPEETDEKAKFLNDLLNGKHELLREAKVHLIINSIGNINEHVFNALKQQHGRNLERHTVNKSD